MENEILSEMSAFELVDLLATYFDLTNSTLTVLISVFFAYLVLCHFAASKIKKSQLAIISSLYSLFVLNQILYLANHLSVTSFLQAYMSTQYSDIDPVPFWATMATPAVALIGWIMSIIYMLTLWPRK